MLNPVRAKLRSNPHEWNWSSYRPTVGLTPAPGFLSLDWLQMLDADRRKAQALFRSFVIEGIERSPATGT